MSAVTLGAFVVLAALLYLRARSARGDDRRPVTPA